MRVLAPCSLLALLVLVGCGLAGRDGPAAASGPAAPVVVPPVAGTGAFSASPTSATPVVLGFPVDRLSVADVDGDGRGDVVAAYASPLDARLVWLRATVGGALETSRTIVALGGVGDFDLADVDGDGFPDVAVMDSVAKEVRVLRNQRDGTFAPTSTVGFADSGASVRFGHFDDDAHLDLVVAGGSNMWRCAGDGVGGFVPTGSGPVPHPVHGVVAVGDFDGVGEDEVVTATTFGAMGSTGYWDLMTLHPGGTTQRSSVASGSWPYSRPRFARLEAGAVLGVVVQGGTSALELWTGYVAGQGYLDHVLRMEPSAIADTAVGDLDLDGIDDLIVALMSADVVEVALGDGTGDVVDVAPVAVSSPTAVALGDVDGDGVKDLVVADVTASVTVRLGVPKP